VRCASCAHVWTAETQDPSDLPTLQPAPPETSQAEGAADKPHRVFRERQERKRRTMSAAVAGSAWGGLAIACALLLTASWFFRVDIVTLWPRATSAYAAVGAVVNPYGYTVGELTVTRDSSHGVPLLVIEGSIRNLDRRTRPLPVLRAVLRDEHSESLLEWNVSLQGAAVPAGQVREFRTVVSDPPPASSEAEVVLVGDGVPEAQPQPAAAHDEPPVDGHDTPAAQHAAPAEEHPAPGHH
tara:strand:+ start:11119 stop:11838 length:720 start_codon:yes stop_codon:yes gene_type:complete